MYHKIDKAPAIIKHNWLLLQKLIETYYDEKRSSCHMFESQDIDATINMTSRLMFRRVWDSYFELTFELNDKFLIMKPAWDSISVNYYVGILISVNDEYGNFKENKIIPCTNHKKYRHLYELFQYINSNDECFLLKKRHIS